MDSIPDSEFKIIRPYLRKAALKKKTASVEDGDGSGRVYFPTAGLVSYIVSTSRGEQLEIYAAGWRDVIGLAASGQPWQAKVQIEGNAMTVSRSELFACLKRMHAFSDVLLNYLAELTARAGQRVCCAHFHTASSRVCSWLAVAMDTTGRVGLECTQQSIADAIGSRRATVTVVLGDLEKQNLIRCERGRINVTDRPGLEAQACECLSYHVSHVPHKGHRSSRHSRRAASGDARLLH